MLEKRRIFVAAALILALAVWFSVLMPWHITPDPDALYHAVMAQLTWQTGPVVHFPWLDLTSLGKHFADQHFLLHVLQAPFVRIFGLLLGSRISSIVFAVLCLGGSAVLFRLLDFKPYWLWTAFLAVLQPFSTRMVYGKASPLVILDWLACLTATLIFLQAGTAKPKKWALFAIFASSLFFTLTHGGWILQPLTLGVALVCYSCTKKFWTRTGAHAVMKNILPPSLACLFGIAAGILLHPGRSELFPLLWVQVFQIGIATPRQLHLGMEWNHASFGYVLGAVSLPAVILTLCIPGLCFFRKKDPSRNGLLKVAVFGSVVAVTFVAMLKSMRFSEYFQPALAFWTASLVATIDWPRIRENLGPRLYMASQAVFLVCGSFMVYYNINSAYHLLHDQKIFRDGQYAGAMRAISAQAQPGDRVYSGQWDEFPSLWSLDRNLKYVSGLDPTFLYQASSTLALDYDRAAFSPSTLTNDQIWELIVKRTGSKFILLDQVRWPSLSKIVAADPRFEKIGEGDGGIAYRVRD